MPDLSRTTATPSDQSCQSQRLKYGLKCGALVFVGLASLDLVARGTGGFLVVPIWFGGGQSVEVYVSTVSVADSADIYLVHVNTPKRRVSTMAILVIPIVLTTKFRWFIKLISYSLQTIQIVNFTC